MANGTVHGFCSETSTKFYFNSTAAPTHLDIWGHNRGDCDILIYSSSAENGADMQKLVGVTRWHPGDSFAQALNVPPESHLWFTCANRETGSSEPGPGSNCLFDWEIPGALLDPFVGLYAAIDPMYLLLGGKAYLVWVEMHHPHVPRISEIEQVLRSMTPLEQTAISKRARTVAEYAKAIEDAVKAMGNPQ
jgi:hypothetical protein